MYTVREVAEYLKRNEYTVREYLRMGYLKGVKVGAHWRVTQEALDQFLGVERNEQ